MLTTLTVVAIALLYLEAGRLHWERFAEKAPRTEEHRAVIALTKTGPWQYRFGAAVMILAWPLWTYVAKAAISYDRFQMNRTRINAPLR